MKVSLEWIKDFTDYKGTVQEFVDGMTMSGSKVETYDIEGENLSNLVTGYVEECIDHPDSDHMHVCQVNVGDETLQIVCGAPNVAQGQKVIVAKVGAILGEDFKIKKAKLRGVESNGMICSIQELGFTVHEFPNAAENGIYVLPEDAEIGVNALEVIGIGQENIEFEITSNRPDCLSVEGLARESAVTFGDSFTPISDAPTTLSNTKSEDIASVKIEAEDLCSTFIGRVVTDIKIEQSPIWMQKRLRAAGMRPINNIVDITNFVMLTLGQPMHAYDLEFLTDHAIIVRRAQDNEKMTLLDESEIEMDSNNLVIADTSGPVGLAGVMGALNSEVRDTTKSILFESANFDAASVRATAKKYNIRSEASLRFEKGLPIENAQRAMDYACYLIELLDCGKVAQTQITVGKTESEKLTVKYETERLNKIAGLQLSDEDINQILNQLEVVTEYCEEESCWIATIPCFRDDLQLEADLAEEIARIYGYNRIPGEFSKGNSNSLGGRSEKQLDIESVHTVLNGCGAYEVYTYTFVSPGNIDKINLPEEHLLRNELTILNPLGEEYSKMRTSLLPSILNVIEYNVARGNQEGLIYEIGKTYHPIAEGVEDHRPERDQVLPDERQHLAIAKFVSKKDEAAGYFEVKGIIEQLFHVLGIEKYTIKRNKEDYPFLHPGQSGIIYLENLDKPLGYIGTVHPSLKKNFAFGHAVYYADLDIELLLNANRKSFAYKPLPKFPAVTRDLAFVMNQDILVADVESEIKELAKTLLEKIEIFDVYQGKGIAEDKKSVAFSLVFRSLERTLNDQDVNPIVDSIIQEMAIKDIHLRS